MNKTDNLDQLEIAKFSLLASKWWDPKGPSAPLHVINPCRLEFVCQYSDLAQSKLLDVGCGAGILSESLAENGAIVTGIDASEEMIATAMQHALQRNLNVDYQVGTIDDVHDIEFEIITCMELIEHVPEPARLIRACANLLKPGGKLFISTLNRTPKSYALAVLGAEYLLNILPKQTHDYRKFIRPSEMRTMCKDAGLQVRALSGMSYNPFSKSAQLCSSVDVNYLLYAQKEL